MHTHSTCSNNGAWDLVVMLYLPRVYSLGHVQIDSQTTQLVTSSTLSTHEHLFQQLPHLMGMIEENKMRKRKT